MEAPPDLRLDFLGRADGVDGAGEFDKEAVAGGIGDAAVMAGQRAGVSITELLPGVEIAFSVEPLGMLFAALASGLWIINSLYSIGYMRGNNERNQTRFYVMFAVSLAATMGVAFAGNLFTLFLHM